MNVWQLLSGTHLLEQYSGRYTLPMFTAPVHGPMFHGREFAATLLRPVHFLSPYQQSGIHFLIICVIQLLTPNNLSGTWCHICSPDIRNVSALKVLRNRALQIDLHLLTYYVPGTSRVALHDNAFFNTVRKHRPCWNAYPCSRVVSTGLKASSLSVFKFSLKTRPFHRAHNDKTVTHDLTHDVTASELRYHRTERAHYYSY